MVTVTVCAVLVGCTGGGAGEPEFDRPGAEPATSPVPSSRPFALSVDSAVDGDHLVIAGKSNLPDGTVVTIELWRSVRPRRGGLRNLPLGGRDVTLVAGRYETELVPDERSMNQLLADGFGPMQAVSDSVLVCAQVRPSDGSESRQPRKVMDAVGASGARLASSPQRARYGAAWWLEALDTVWMPSSGLAEVESRLGYDVPHQRRVGDPFCVG